MSRFDFCPKCGALARDGVCQSCGHVNQESVPKKSQEQPQQAWDSIRPQQTWDAYQQPQQLQVWQQSGNPAFQKPQHSNKALVTILVIVVIILAMVFTCCAGSLTFYMMDVNIDNLLGINEEQVFPWEEDGEVSDEETIESESKEVTDKKYSEPSKEEERETPPNDSTPGEEQTKPTQDVEGLENGLYYEGLYNALREDLIYQVEFEMGKHAPEEYDGRVTIQVEYPQLTGAAPNLDIINTYLETEYLYYYEYFRDVYEPEITEQSVFYVLSQGYVTYMDDDVMSVVFQEEIYIDGQSMIQFYCLNFDMSDGVVLNNTDILKMDLDFAVDFRRREILENGDEWLTDYTDQEILDLLKDIDHLVIFYTPMGMEVGLNLYEVVLYMTYSDYEKFLNLY